ncbi:pyruvate, phosphate dikinase [Candidatus Micrarchaeota archaeon]|nr:pyruvate, phosphate dikinase [Candidatus Micrarchaeota archaeon]
MKKYVYSFEEGNKDMKSLLGGKGANLAEMTGIGLPVPQGFTITTEACTFYYQHNKNPPAEFDAQVKEKLQELEKKTGKKFGDPENSLLVSVRSGARASMPGMMDTILNLGLNDETLKGIVKKTGNESFAYNAFRRFIQMFGGVVLGVEKAKFEELLEEVKHSRKVKLDTELDADGWNEVVSKYKELVEKETGKPFPSDPTVQLKMAINAVFSSWNNPRAITYRKLNKIPDDWGTAVNVQAMVFGNMGNDSGTGVAFTRNPSTGEKKLYGEYLMNAQGEDVVAGIRTPQPIAQLEKENPRVYAEFKKIAELLERHYKDMQDMEFTIEKGKLYMLQTRNGKRTGKASVRIAVDMVDEGLITTEEALLRVIPTDLNQLMHKSVDPKAKAEVIAAGLAASPGAAVGQIVFDAEEAVEWAEQKKKVILVRPETTPDDIHGMVAAQGILTSRGGMTSHAAVVARGMGKCCVSGAESVKADIKNKTVTAGGHTLKEGDWITLDGTTGRVMLGQVPLVDPSLGGEFVKLIGWADEYRRLRVRANADIPRDAEKAFEFGAEGIGLCRTEHMFFEEGRLTFMQEMIMAENTEDRKKALAKLLPFQRSDFIGLFKAMKGQPVTIRLIDPPLHEFLPSREELIADVAVLKATGRNSAQLKEKEKLLAIVNKLHEFNPMLGLRGIRLGIVYPEITDMQVQAIMEAAVEVTKSGMRVKPEIMIPLVGHVNELKVAKEQTVKVAEEVLAKNPGVKIEYTVGTMIELPRAALTADEIAQEAEFFSFGTNDLTQTTFGFSRDDAEPKFLAYYVDKKILPISPFIELDRNGVGKLVKMGIELGRKTKAKLKVGICGEHGGDPSSIEFCHMVGMDYVSCSPFRVPIARLAAAQAAIREKQGMKEEIHMTA